MTILKIITFLAVLAYCASRLNRILDYRSRKAILKYFEDRGYEVLSLEPDLSSNFSGFGGSSREPIYRVDLAMEDGRLSRWEVRVPWPLAYWSDRFIGLVEIPPQIIEVAEERDKKLVDRDWWDAEVDGPR
jgi:hypothetical protein